MFICINIYLYIYTRNIYTYIYLYIYVHVMYILRIYILIYTYTCHIYTTYTHLLRPHIRPPCCHHRMRMAMLQQSFGPHHWPPPAPICKPNQALLFPFQSGQILPQIKSVNKLTFARTPRATVLPSSELQIHSYN